MYNFNIYGGLGREIVFGILVREFTSHWNKFIAQKPERVAIPVTLADILKMVFSPSPSYGDVAAIRGRKPLRLLGDRFTLVLEMGRRYWKRLFLLQRRIMDEKLMFLREDITGSEGDNHDGIRKLENRWSSRKVRDRTSGVAIKGWCANRSFAPNPLSVFLLIFHGESYGRNL
jgi:hypothetical protein